jgi:hypothetical protein
MVGAAAVSDLYALELEPGSPVLDKPIFVQIVALIGIDLVTGSPFFGEAEAPITAFQSYSQVIRDALFAKTVLLPFFAGFTARRSKQLPIQQFQVPYLGVYLIAEDMLPDGDANAGDVRFIHRLQVGWQIVIENNDPVAAELKLDQAFWSIMNGIWRDPRLMNFIQSDMPDNTRIEAVERGRRVNNWGAYGLNNEKPYGELQYYATLIYRASYDPIITDDLLDIHVEMVPLADDGTVPDSSEVQRIIVEYELPASRSSRPALIQNPRNPLSRRRKRRGAVLHA